MGDAPRLRHEDFLGKLRHKHGWKRGHKDPRDLLFKASFWDKLRIPDTGVIPDEKALKVEDQGSIGSCTCNSSTSAEEYALHRQGIDVQLSRMYPYAKVRDFEGTPLSEDSGAQIRNVQTVLAKWGSPLESSYPYDVSKFTQEPPTALDDEAAKYKLAMYYRCPDLSALLLSLSQGFPVVFGFQCPANMFSDEVARSGVIPMPDKEGFDGGHAVLATGWDKSKRFVRFLNSWGPNFGDGGFGFLPFDYFLNCWADDYWTQRRAGV